MKDRHPSRIFFWFIALLALCTYFSATITSMLAARVTLCVPLPQVLEDHTFVSSVVPESALVLENQRFIATEQSDLWGSFLVARPVLVKTMEIGDGQVAILEGLVGNERVIISWDRPLDMGMRVIEE